MRNRLQDRQKSCWSKERKRAHASAMMAQAALQSAQLGCDVSALRAALTAAEAHLDSLPTLTCEMDKACARLDNLTRAEVAPSTAMEAALTDTSVLLEAAPSVFAVQLTDLVDATDNFAQERRIGKGGFGEVFCAEAIASLVPEKQPPGLQARRMAVKRASAAIERRDLECEVTMLQSCAHSHLLPLLGWCLEAACLVFPLMVGGSLQSRLDLAPQDVDYLQRWAILSKSQSRSRGGKS